MRPASRRRRHRRHRRRCRARCAGAAAAARRRRRCPGRAGHGHAPPRLPRRTPASGMADRRALRPETFRNGMDPLAILRYVGGLGRVHGACATGAGAGAGRPGPGVLPPGLPLRCWTPKCRRGGRSTAAFSFVRDDCQLQPAAARAGRSPSGTTAPRLGGCHHAACSSALHRCPAPPGRAAGGRRRGHARQVQPRCRSSTPARHRTPAPADDSASSACRPTGWTR
jgi:hypothetical protein